MGISYTPARSAAIEYKADCGMIPCSAVATSARQDEWTISIGDVHRFILAGNRIKAEELLQAYGELYDLAFPITAKPRKLNSLDCEEARNGTIWVESAGPRWQYRCVDGVWLYRSTYSGWKKLDLSTRVNMEFYMNEIGPYTEVVE